MASLPTRGIDISEFNGDVNIDALRGQIDFVIIQMCIRDRAWSMLPGIIAKS